MTDFLDREQEPERTGEPILCWIWDPVNEKLEP